MKEIKMRLYWSWHMAIGYVMFNAQGRWEPKWAQKYVSFYAYDGGYKDFRRRYLNGMV